MPHHSTDSPPLRCMRCGYDLRGLDGKTASCPECAVPIVSSREWRDRGIPRSRRNAMWIALASSGGFLGVMWMLYTWTFNQVDPLAAVCVLLGSLTVAPAMLIVLVGSRHFERYRFPLPIALLCAGLVIWGVMMSFV